MPSTTLVQHSRLSKPEMLTMMRSSGTPTGAVALNIIAEAICSISNHKHRDFQLVAIF
jgi:hypothetical protein